MRSLLKSLCLCGVFAAPFISLPVKAQACEIALVLAFDASSSVNSSEYELQLEGTADALLSDEVTNAILGLNGVYLTAFEWNGHANQSMLFNWTYLDDKEDIELVADKIVNHERNDQNSATALGEALIYSYNLLQQLDEPCFRKVVDVSGDGESNIGPKPKVVYENFDFSEIMVNGLAIVDPDRKGKTYYQAIDEYYEKYLIKGPGSFVITAQGFDDFARAIHEKLLKELTPGPIGLINLNGEAND